LKFLHLQKKDPFLYRIFELTVKNKRFKNMKRFIIALIITASSTISFAQINPHAFGVRLGGGGYGGGGEFSYQHGLGDQNRFELDLGIRFGKFTDNGIGNDYSHIVFTGIYHWHWNITDGLNWYVGPGAQVGFWRYRTYDGDEGLTIAAGGQIGLEYDFNQHGAPILLSLDARPMWGVIGPGSGFGYGGALGIRYTW
jgi:hypothetical protein